MTVGKGWWLAERTGRVLLLGAVAFWWGLIVVPRLVSLAFPELLSLDAIPRHLDPEQRGKPCQRGLRDLPADHGLAGVCNGSTSSPCAVILDYHGRLGRAGGYGGLSGLGGGLRVSC